MSLQHGTPTTHSSSHSLSPATISAAMLGTVCSNWVSYICAVYYANIYIRGGVIIIMNSNTGAGALHSYACAGFFSPEGSFVLQQPSTKHALHESRTC